MTTEGRWAHKLVTPEEAVARVRPGEVVLWAPFAEPSTLMDSFVRQRERLRGTVMAHNTPVVPFPWLDPDFGDYFRIYENFPGVNTREAVRNGWAEYIPWPFGLSRRERASIPERRNLYARPDIYLTRITEPDGDGYVSFGTFPWYAQEAVTGARLVIGELDPTLVRTNACAHISQMDCLVPAAPAAKGPRRALPVTPPEELEVAQVIGSLAAELIHDGDTIQVGTGPASESMVEFLRQRQDLGVHSELIFPSIVELVRDGVITGARKSVDGGKVVTAGLFLHPDDQQGPEALRFVGDHPDLFDFRSIGYVANVKTVTEQENIVAVNNVLACDLTGQVVVNNLGTTPIGGIGGNFDFTVGAHYAKGGRSIHCLMSTAKGGTLSRIVPQHPGGAVVSIPRTMVDYLVTEYGVVNLEGRSLRERARAIIAVAHPDFRGELEAAARKLELV
ncbi:MAG: acetyl-CoA hydrolase/transferase family protein [Dehalococcoidia bacterium]